MVVVDRKGDVQSCFMKVGSHLDVLEASWRCVENGNTMLLRQPSWMLNTNKSTWRVPGDLKFVSDPTLFGRYIVELNATNNALIHSYVWALDVSGSLDGAGGVGGLLWVTLHTASGPASGTHFTCYNGNGNIVALVSATTGDVTARYEYGPFAELIRISGPAASLNHFRFSTKRMDSTTDLVLFEYWAYRPTTGRWPNRDPLDEQGGRNLYGFNYNNTIQFYDPDGRNPAVIVIGGVTVAVGECVLLAVITCMATPPCRDALIDLVRSGVRARRLHRGVSSEAKMVQAMYPARWNYSW